MAEYPAASAGLNVQPVAPANPLELAQQSLALQNTRQTMQMNALKLQQAQQDAQDEQDVRAAAQQSGGDLDKISQVLQSRNPRAAAKFNQEVASQRKSQAETDEINMKAAGAKLDLFQRRAQEVQDQQGWQSLLQDPSFKDYTKTLSPTFDAGNRDQIVQSLLPAKDAVDAHLKAVQMQQEKQKIDLEAQKGQRDQSEADQKKNELDMHIAAQVMSQVKDQPSHDNALQYLKASGVSPNVINLYGSQYTPDTASKAKGYLTAGQKLDTHDEELAAYNANLQAVKTYGPGEEGMRRRNMAEGQAMKLQEVAAATAERLAAEKASKASNAPEFQDPNFRTTDISKVEGEKKKIDDKYNAALANQSTFSSAINSARSGNKAAYSMLSQMMVNEVNSLNGIKRANAAEFGRVDRSGSALDKLQGWIGALQSGKSVSPSVINDMDSFFKTISGKAAESEKNLAIQSLDSTYHTRYGATSNAPAPAAGGWKIISVK